MKTRNILASVAALGLLANAHAARATEYYVGDAIEKNNLVIEPNYLTGIEMSRMPEGMASGPDVVHLEVDAHAAAHEPHGFAEKEWIPYLTVGYTIEKIGGGFKKIGHLFAMTAGDGPHYANNVALAGLGRYRLTYRFAPPSSAGFIRHIDQATGVPDWWKPFSLSWTFAYPGKAKSGE